MICHFFYHFKEFSPCLQGMPSHSVSIPKPRFCVQQCAKAAGTLKVIASRERINADFDIRTRR